MNLPIQPDPLPLRDDGRGGLRVGNSCVPLDVVLREYDAGADAEGIVSAYPSLRLADVHAVIAYRLNHPTEVDAYLRRRQAEAEALRREIDARQPGRGDPRARLEARRAARERQADQEQGHASARP